MIIPCTPSSSTSTDGIATPSSTAAGGQDAQPATDSGQYAFRDARVSFAVDTSGSTFGPTLAAEKLFIKNMAQQLSPQARLQGRILPWSSNAQRVQSISHIDSLTSGGGTVPSVILDDPNHRRTLAQSSLWFLMTDGLIHSRDRVQFAIKLAQAGIHGTSCVVVIFDDPHSDQTGREWAGNISVGVSVFAVVPNCAFLLFETRTGDMRILQAKGVFNCLFKGQTPPTFRGDADWSSFPRVTPSDFSNVVTHTPRKLDADEIALQGSQVVNMEDLFANKLRQDEVSRILSNDDDLSSLIMTAQSRNQQHVFQGWIQQQRLQPVDPATAPREDIDGAAQQAFRELMLSQQRGQPLASTTQGQLQAAHAKNMSQFVQSFQMKMNLAQQRDRLITQAHMRSTTSIDAASTLTPTSAYEPAGPPPFGPAPQLKPLSMATRPSPSHPTSSWSNNDVLGLRSLLYTPGFRSATGSFTGTCPICQGEGRTLSLLFKSLRYDSADSALVRNAAEAGSYLHLGCSARLQILSSTICCDPCSSFCVKLGMSEDAKEKIIASIPLVRLVENRSVFHTALHRAFEGRFPAESRPELLLSVVLTALGRPNLSSTVQAALRWSSIDLLQSIYTKWPAAGMNQSRPALGVMMQQSLAMLEGPFLLQCHIYAFVLMVRGAGLLGTPFAMRRAAVMRRFVYSVAEGLCMRLDALRHEKISTSDAVRKIFRDVLWQQSSETSEGSRAPHPVLSISPRAVDDMDIMTPRTFLMLRQAQEFRDLMDPDLSWPGHSTALLLHKLCEVMSNDNSPKTPQQLFVVFEADDMVQRAMRWPEQIRDADVAAVAR